ncbi:MAG: glycosyltransferase family 2 protein [Candidatus Bathyarchaeia archaeon]
MTLRVTAAIPCYNGAPYIGAVIESLLQQTCPPDEVLVVDDGSIDGSAEIVSQYPVRLLRHKSNQGVAAARNTAIEAATGDIILFVDADAVADPDLLKILLEEYRDKDVGGVGGQGIEVNIRSLADQWRRRHATQSFGDKPKDVEFLFGLCMSFRIEVLRKLGGFRSVFRSNAEDIDMGLRLRKAGYRLRYLPDAKVYHQRTDNEASLKRTMAAWYQSAYKARHLNEAYPWKLFAGTLRRLITDPLSDLVEERNLQMARLSWEIGWVKLRALWMMDRVLRRGGLKE